MMMRLIVLRGFLLWIVAALAVEDEECTVYLAESTVKNGGFGVFAGKVFQLGDVVGTPGVSIPILDAVKIRDSGALREYLQNAANIGGSSEGHRVLNMLPGLRSLTNYHSALTNVIQSGTTHSSTDRYRDPMAGANSPYSNFTLIASKTIGKGQEIFVEAPLDWFKEAEFPLEDDYKRVKEIVDALAKQYDSSNLSEDQWIDILYRLKAEMMPNEAPGVRQLMPRSAEEILKIRRWGILNTTRTPRDFDWIKRNGYCLDNIRQADSTVIGAGRGAFATRSLAAGSIITPMPLVHIKRRSVLSANPRPSNITQQLLLNYCFGHRMSQLLLCPTTHGALINHNSLAPNAKIQWSRTSLNRLDADTNYRLEGLDALDVDATLKTNFNTRLAFEVIATRSIEEGQEIFLDYGHEWEAQLDEHLAKWTQPNDDSYMLPERSKTLLLSSELPHFHAHECRMEPLASENGHGVLEDYRTHIYTDRNKWIPKMKALYEKNDFICWHPCTLVEANADGTFRADVMSKLSPTQRIMRFVTNMPPEAIRVVDAQYMSDIHIMSSFRYFIPIPGPMFPSRWRSDYISAAQANLGRRSTGIDMSRPENAHHIEKHEAMVRDAECGVYFAPSNIPNAGFGTYTAVPLLGRGIVVGTSIPVLPVPADLPRPWNGADYVWGGHVFDAQYESAGAPEPLGKTNVLAVNDGALANSHLGLVNEKMHPAVFEPQFDICKDPGAGAISDYVKFAFKSDYALGQGEELFVSYGDAWFTGRTAFADVPVSQNWEEANAILASIWTMSQLNDNEFSDNETIGLLNTIQTSIIKERRTKVALGTVSSFKDLSRVIERQGAAQATMQVRTPEWLQQYGQCIDHVYVKESFIPQAGKGGFARRFLKDGSVVMSAPLMTTFGADMLTLNVTKAKESYNKNDLNEKLLLLNYQFTHPESSVYFFPIIHAFMLNHASSRSYGRASPNAKLQWATWNKKSSYFLHRSLDDLKKETYSTIVMDVVATRDIKADEEILIDYGTAWESAWYAHLKHWKSPCSATGRKGSLAVKNMNSDKFNTRYHSWSKDHFTTCHLRKDVGTEWIHIVKPGDAIPNVPNEIIVTSHHGITYSHSGFNYTTAEIGGGDWPCKILNANVGEKTFKVAVMNLEWESRVSEVPEARVLKVMTISEQKLKFISRPFRSDMFWEGAFRHPVHIPDEIFPVQWKDLGISV